MVKPEWGAKHTCQSCGVKYYDLRRSPVVCPKCKTEFNPDALLRSRRSKPAAPEKAAAPAAAVAQAATPKDEEVAADGQEEGQEDEALVALEGEEEGADEVAEAEDEDDELIEDASELGEDDEDMAEVMVGEDEREDT